MNTRVDIRRILILGGGTAGLLAAIAFRTRFPDLEVTLVRSPEIAPIGVGEGSTPVLPSFLHGFCGIDPGALHATANPTWKVGLRFVNWGPRPFFNYTFTPQVTWKWDDVGRETGFHFGDDFDALDAASALMSAGKAFERQPNGDPLIPLSTAYHIETGPMAAAFEQIAVERGVKLVEDTMAEAQVEDVRGGPVVRHLTMQSGRQFAADLFIDCSGFRSKLVGELLDTPFVSFQDSLWCDRAIVGRWPRTSEPILPYTLAETMNAGWSWQIEHEHFVNRGYVFSSSFISETDAEAEFRTRNPKIGTTRLLQFPSGRRRDCWVGNVVAIGNAAGFVEPLEATALTVICDEIRILSNTLRETGMSPGPATARLYNTIAERHWDSIRRFLAVHYRFNTRSHTTFWREAREGVDLAGGEPIVEWFMENGPNSYAADGLVMREDPFGLDGYFTLLLGMSVPHQAKVHDDSSMRSIIAARRTTLRKQASAGMTVAEALAVVRSPEWQWRVGFYPEGRWN